MRSPILIHNTLTDAILRLENQQKVLDQILENLFGLTNLAKSTAIVPSDPGFFGLLEGAVQHLHAQIAVNEDRLEILVQAMDFPPNAASSDRVLDAKMTEALSQGLGRTFRP